MNLTETSEEEAYVSIVQDIAVLARKFAKKEPFKSASGPEALLALASHLDGMVTTTRRGHPLVISVSVRSRRKKSN
jgi:hypothetical protein